ncbi:trimeric intracellular cation channel family protein [Leadbetterella byssophila]|uniref:Uncharacterized protein family UPF0126 n=1 Tax=Leadbetterella byssophila (strain DSM 17132 / JCM 16389 / KACC 11308 / NBRC 106382 / 4M15) TaxID=649349 RepID=E4RQU4_LEAB4|nr:trimeric intracellular cation channel family protein [Leadbetterella byssophila]ADQ18387.1 Uncharacterized protein family UPF0126 [Leadbetterella byssophila DSM 17132]
MPEIDLLKIINVLGTFAFAISGATMAMSKKLDAFGVLVIAFVTSIGGGTLRDILIGNLPVGWLSSDFILLIILITSLLTLFFYKYLNKLSTTLFLFDALGIGLFTIAGAEIAEAKGFNIPICITLGTITACFGGVLRDVLLNHVPLIFRKELYATACIIGAAVYFFNKKLGLNSELNTFICIGIIVALRIWAVRYKIYLPSITIPDQEED